MGGSIVFALTKRSNRSIAFVGRIAIGLAALATGSLLNGTAGALVVEHLSSASSFTYDFVPGLPGLHAGTGDSKVFEVTGPDLTHSTDVKVNYGTVLASDASFFFLHNIQCQGYCSIGVTTTITDTITNTGPSAVDLRLDSAITAGHFGLVHNAATDSSGLFQFDVSQHSGGVNHELYKALGQISSSGATITTSDGSVFNNMKTYDDPAQMGLDWDETDLSLLLDSLAPGQTTTLTYTSFTYLNSYGVCTNFNLCDGVQVAFGDPRNNGGILFAAPLSLPKHQPLGYVLNRGFDMAVVEMKLVNLSSSVPEPASWTMLMLGFGLTGAFARRQRGSALAAA